MSFDLFISQPPGPHLARTFLALALLLPSAHEADDENLVRYAESAIHMLYSSQIPPSVYELAVRRGIHGFEQATKQVEMSPDFGGIGAIPVTDVIYGPKWTVKTVFQPATYLDTLRYLKPDGVPVNFHCQSLRKWDLLTKLEHSDLSQARMAKSRFNGMCRWREDSILLPFGHPRDEFQQPNP